VNGQVRALERWAADEEACEWLQAERKAERAEALAELRQLVIALDAASPGKPRLQLLEAATPEQRDRIAELRAIIGRPQW
jgi:hypothetical protein